MYNKCKSGSTGFFIIFLDSVLVITNFKFGFHGWKLYIYLVQLYNRYPEYSTNDDSLKLCIYTIFQFYFSLIKQFIPWQEASSIRSSTEARERGGRREKAATKSS